MVRHWRGGEMKMREGVVECLALEEGVERVVWVEWVERVGRGRGGC